MNNEQEFGQLRLVGRISLWFTAVALAGLLLVFLLNGHSENNYFDAVQSLSMTRQNLPLIMLIGGLLLAAGTGLTTWLITLISSFRVAGPLYRFSRNLETGIRTGRVPRIRIRNTDYLHTESEQLEKAVE